ncbi:MAG: nucleotidyltransferase family protein [Gammaproteobacteria bacterium]|nr:nucleotidyltransferase family protein [Gammaproteobacteria bacterium]
MSGLQRPQVAMILAAGRGDRMRPLTDDFPKPLLKAGDKPLIHYHLEGIAKAGIGRVVVNHAHLGAMIEADLGDGSRWGVRIEYSPEPPGALETGGGIFNALGRLGEGPFLVVNGDVWSNCNYADLAISDEDWAHLLLVENPPHHRQGDFALTRGRVHETGDELLTFAGIGVYRAALFQGCRAGAFPLAPLLRTAMREGRVSGARLLGAWTDVGTPERLRQLDLELRQGR